MSVAAGLTDRKRPFSLLRLTGAPLGMLRRVVALETAVPLADRSSRWCQPGWGSWPPRCSSSPSSATRSSPPGAGYYLIVLAGLAASLGIIASTLPLLRPDHRAGNRPQRVAGRRARLARDTGTGLACS